MITLSWHEIVSWLVAVVSATLFLVERRKNDNTKYYMVLASPGAFAPPAEGWSQE